MKKRMCENWIDIPCDKRGQSIHRCPKNTNSKCEIITPPKKVRRIKAWARVINVKGVKPFIAEIKLVKNGEVPKLKWIEAATSVYIPVTILIEERYLKGGKK